MPAAAVARAAAEPGAKALPAAAEGACVVTASVPGKSLLLLLLSLPPALTGLGMATGGSVLSDAAVVLARGDGVVPIGPEARLPLLLPAEPWEPASLGGVSLSTASADALAAVVDTAVAALRDNLRLGVAAASGATSSLLVAGARGGDINGVDSPAASVLSEEGSAVMIAVLDETAVLCEARRLRVATGMLPSPQPLPETFVGVKLSSRYGVVGTACVLLLLLGCLWLSLAMTIPRLLSVVPSAAGPVAWSIDNVALTLLEALDLRLVAAGGTGTGAVATGRVAIAVALGTREDGDEEDAFVASTTSGLVETAATAARRRSAGAGCPGLLLGTMLSCAGKPAIASAPAANPRRLC